MDKEIQRFDFILLKLKIGILFAFYTFHKGWFVFYLIYTSKHYLPQSICAFLTEELQNIQNQQMGVEKHSMSVLHVDLDRLGITES